jgi:hypothetical protein
MYVPVAAEYAKRESEKLSKGALHDAPVIEPHNRGRTEVGRVRRGTAAALRRSADRIAPLR